METDIEPINPAKLADVLSSIINMNPTLKDPHWRDLSDRISTRDQAREHLVRQLAISEATDRHSVAVGIAIVAGVLFVHPTADFPRWLAIRVVQLIDMLGAEI